MDALEMMLQFCDSGLSLQDARDLMVTCGYSAEAVQDAITSIVEDDSIQFRVVNAPYPTNAKLFIA